MLSRECGSALQKIDDKHSGTLTRIQEQVSGLAAQVTALAAAEAARELRADEELRNLGLQERIAQLESGLSREVDTLRYPELDQCV